MAAERDEPPVLELRILRGPGEQYGVEMRVGDREFPRGAVSREVLALGDANSIDGERLFAALTADDAVRIAWHLASALHPRRQIRLRIDDACPELHALPWESLHDPSPSATAHFLAADRDTPFARHVACAWEPLGSIPTAPIRVLSAVADPTDLADYELPALDREREVAAIAEALAAAPPGLIEHTHLAGPCTLAALEAELERGHHVLHLLAHGGLRRGGDAVATFFEGPDGRVDRVDAVRFAAMIERLSPSLRLTVLMSCHSATRSPRDARVGLAPQLLAAGVPAVLAMQDLIPVDTARAFTRAFYQELWSSHAIDRAANRARAVLLTERMPGGAIPVLYLTPRSNLLLHRDGFTTPQTRAQGLPAQPPVAEMPAPPVAPTNPVPPPPPANPIVPARSAAPAPEASASSASSAAPIAPAPATAPVARSVAPAPATAQAPESSPRRFGAWEQLGGPYTQILAARQADGCAWIWAIDPEGKLGARRQTRPGGAWGAWQAIAGAARDLAVHADRRGRLHLVLLGVDGGLRYARQDRSSGAWAAPGKALPRTWVSLGLHSYHEGEVLVYAIDGDRGVHYLGQDVPDGGWDGEWENTRGVADQVTAARDVRGAVHALAVDRRTNTLRHSFQRDADSDFSAWVKLDGAVTQVEAIADERAIHLFALTPGGTVQHRHRTGNAWSAWRDLGGAGLRSLAALRSEGALELFALDGSGDLWHLSAADAAEPAAWARLGGPGFTRLAVTDSGRGRIEVLCLDREGTLHHLAEAQP